MKSNTISLVGAGPGDPELITLKGAHRLQQADVVLYDALVHTDLLKLAPRAIKVFVGKRSGRHALKQDEINRLILKYATKFERVVRLKGGDPFVFGRGQEEVEFLRQFNLDAEVIPGLSSATAIPTSQGISLTNRGVAGSFWVLTGTTQSGKLSQDLILAAKSNATVVVLMGRERLFDIAELYKLQGKAELPIAIVENGTLESEKIILSTIESVVDLAGDAELSGPVLLIIGEVVKHHPYFLKEIAKQHLKNPFSLN